MFLAEVSSSSSNLPLEILGSLGGIVAFIVGVIAIIKSILRQVTATENNTSATQANTVAIDDLKKGMSELNQTVNIQAERIAGQGREIADLRRVVFNGGSKHANGS